MKRQEAIEHFKENVANEQVAKCKEQFQEKFIKNEEKFAFPIMDAMKSIIEKAEAVKELDENYKLSVFQFELLRSNIVNETYKIWLHGYNSLWYLDENSITEEIDLSILFEPFTELKKTLVKAKKVYMGKINNYDIQNIILNTATECYMSLTETVREYMWDLDEEEWMDSDSVGDFYSVKWSEYKGKSETIFAMDNRQKTSEDFKVLQKEKEEKLPFVYSVWKNSSLEAQELIDKNLLFINFKDSILKNMNFSESKIVRGQFKNTEISHCNFDNAILVGSFFENSKIEGCSFENTDLTNVDFSNATFKEVSFKNAIIKDTIFSEKQVPFLHLTPEQLQLIYIQGGE